MVELQRDTEWALHSRVKDNQGLEFCLRWSRLMGTRDAVWTASSLQASTRRPPTSIYPTGADLGLVGLGGNHA